MENENTQFDGREALIAGNAIRIRSPNRQKKRISKDYAEKIRDLEPETDSSEPEEDVFSARREAVAKIPEDGPDNGHEQGQKRQKKDAVNRQRKSFNSLGQTADSVRKNAFHDTAGDAEKTEEGLLYRSRRNELLRSRRYVRGGHASIEPAEEQTDSAGKKQYFFTDEVKAGQTAEDEALSEYSNYSARRYAGTANRSGTVPGKRKAGEIAGDEGTSGRRNLSGNHVVSGGFTNVRNSGSADVSHFSTGRMGGGMNSGRAGSAFYAAGTGGQESTLSASVLQKRRLRRAYTAANEQSVYIPIISKIRERRAYARAAKESERGVAAALQALRRRPVMAVVVIFVMLFVFFFSAAASAGTAVIGQAASSAITATSYSAEDEDILGAESDYLALEAELREKLSDPERYFPGYDNYSLQSTEISHDPYKLTALLTVLYERYTRNEVQESLRKIFNAQYGISTEDITGTSEQKTVRIGQSLGTVVTSGYCNCSICCGPNAGGPTASGVYPTEAHTIAVDSRNPIVPMGTKIVMNGTEYTVEDTGPLERYGVAFDVYYDDHDVAESHGHQNWEAFIADDNGTETVTVTVTNTQPTLKVTLRNYGIDHAARELLNDDLYLRYQLMAQLKGNREGLFPDYDAMAAYGGLNYAPPGSALSDAQFAAMYYEAVKYLGIEYVWGGETPESGFDCSGFVSYVINHCGNGWDFGRLTAEEWRQTCMYVPPAEAKPGDLIFFQGTYDTDGASHIGIYLGEGMMVHAGHPVQIASCETPYFQEHFLSYGRIPG